MSIHHVSNMPTPTAPFTPRSSASRHPQRGVWVLSFLLAAAVSLPSAAAAGGGKNQVRAVKHATATASRGDVVAGTTTIRIAGTRTPTFTMYKLERPARVVVDIANATLARDLTGRDAKATWPVASWSVTQVETHALKTRGRATVRVIVSMARAATYDVKASGKNLLVVVTPRDAAPPSAAKEAAQAKGRATELASQLATAEDRASQARRDAERARADARRAATAEKQALAAARTANTKVATSAKKLRELRGARAEADAARREIAALKSEAAAARRDADAARETARKREIARRAAERREAELRASAAAREAELRAAEKREAKLRAEAERAVAEARAEAVGAKARAEERVRKADARMAAAKDLIEDAQRRSAAAEKAEKAAKASERAAKAATRQVAEREREAKAAKKQLTERRAQAERAERAAREYLRRARDNKSDSDASAALRKRAEKAAKDAERRRAQAERAAVVAEQARAAAEKAAKNAEKRQHKAVAALRTAEREKRAAQSALTEAEKRRAAADEQRRTAETRRTEAEAAAAEADRRAERAHALRIREEAAYARVVKARRRANDDRKAAAAASARLQRAKNSAKEAEARLATTRRGVADAESRLAAVAESKDTSARELAELRAEAKRLASERKRAQRDLGAHKRDIKQQERALSALQKTRASKAEELAKVERAAAKARTAREREEKLLAELIERRASAERALMAAEKKRERAEAGAAERASAEKTARAAAAQRTALAKKAASTAIAAVDVEQVSFDDRDKVARIVIGLSGKARPRVVSTSDRKAILEITGARLPNDLQRTLDTSRYVGPIESISSYRDPRDASKTRVVVRLERSAKNALKRSGSTYYWDFAKTRTEVAQASANRSRTKAKNKARSRRQAPMVVGGYGASSTPITQKTVAQLSKRKRKVYRGTKIDLDFKDADIHNLLRTLADVGGVNIVIPDEIQARVTVRLRRVPWDQALEVILASKGLWYRREGNLYRVALRKQLDAEDEAEAQRLANLVKTEAPEPEIFTLNYAVAENLKEQLAPLLSPKGRIEVDTRTNSLIINDVRANRRRVVDLLKMLDTQTPQVQIEARIVEARSSFTREIGVQWGGGASASRGGGNATGLIFPNSIGIRGGGEDNNTVTNGVSPSPSDFAVNLPAAVGAGAGGAIGLALGSVGGNFNLSLRLSALEDTGRVRIISQPKITVLDNVRAEISQGVSIPVAVVSANGTQTQFVPADLSLKVTPHVSQRDCSVQMDLDVQKNEPDFVNTGARGDPSILRKEAKTTVLVADGETTVIGGIYTRNTGLSFSKVPFFGDLPVFGWFFKNRREADERSEVLVFITPKITNKSSLRCE